jgi:hypothetical protein
MRVTTTTIIIEMYAVAVIVQSVHISMQKYDEGQKEGERERLFH